jgi:hypothetical protein
MNRGESAGKADPDAASEASICIGCGLCCDGTVVTYLAVSDESDLGLPLRGLGVELIYESDPPVFELPCPAVSHGVCTIHALHRPRACHAFECSLSTAVSNGECSPERALSIIAEVLEIRMIGAGSAESEAKVRALVARHFIP